MKKVFTILTFVILSQTIFAQQEVQFTQFMFNNLYINPGYAGINKQICITTLLRQQWVGFTDPDGNKVAPQTYLLAIDAPVRFLRGGIGLNVYNDKLGFENNLGIKLSYSFHQPIGPGVLGIGASASFLNKTIDYSKLHAIDPGDQTLSPTGTQSTFMVDAAFGLFYNIPSKFYVGLSSSQLIQTDMKLPNTLGSELRRHYYLTGAYHWTIASAPDWELSPFLLVKSDLASTSFDFAAMVKFQQRFWFFTSYRWQDAVCLSIGAAPFNAPGRNPALANLKIGYSYDITTSQMGKDKRSSGSHEIMLGYCFKISVPTKVTKYINTRFL